LRHEAVQPVGEDVPRNTQVLVQLVEATEPEEDISDDQERPTLAYHLERPCDRAVLPVVVAFQHEPNRSTVELHHATRFARVLNEFRDATYTEEGHRDGDARLAEPDRLLACRRSDRARPVRVADSFAPLPHVQRVVELLVADADADLRDLR